MPTLSSDAALAYWDRRHRDEDLLRSGGHVGTDRPGNEAFYAVRLGRLLELAGDRVSEHQPAFALDAGCGKGLFATALARCGWTVDAVDASPAAVAAARARDADGAVRWVLARLDDWRPPYTYDLVCAVDVLFHLVEDADWEASLHALAALVRPAGRLVVTDAEVPERQLLGDYIVHRPLRAYRELLGGHGLELADVRPYAFRESTVAFAAFERRG